MVFILIIISVVLSAIITIASNIREKRKTCKVKLENKTSTVVVMPYAQRVEKKPFYWARPPMGFVKRENISDVSELISYQCDHNKRYIISGIYGQFNSEYKFACYTDALGLKRMYQFDCANCTGNLYLNENEVLRHVFKTHP